MFESIESVETLQVGMACSRHAVNTSLYVHNAHPWAQPFGQLALCKSSILTICHRQPSLAVDGLEHAMPTCPAYYCNLYV